MTFHTIVHQLLMIPLALFGVGFIIGFHELGHFIFCKLFGIRTPSFSIGFGPRIIQKRIGDTDFALSAIPLGGYVEIAGAEEVGQGDQKEAKRSDEQSFAKKPYYQKMLVIAGGIIFNLIFAYTVLTLIFWSGVGKTPLLYPYNATATISEVLPNTPAATANLQAGDKLLKLNEQDITDATMAQFITKDLRAAASTNAELLIQRGEITMPIAVQLGDGVKTRLLGAVFSTAETPGRPFIQAAAASITLVNQLIVSTFASLAGMVNKKSMDGFGGPVAIISQTVKSTEGGFSAFLLILCIISVSLAVLNVLPLPIFDGGQALFYTLEAITGKSLDNVRVYIHYASWVLVIGLTLYLTFKDVTRLFQ